MLLNAMNSNSTLKFFLLLVLEFLGEIEQATGKFCFSVILVLLLSRGRKLKRV